LNPPGLLLQDHYHLEIEEIPKLMTHASDARLEVTDKSD